jgi:hypothetical protein
MLFQNRQRERIILKKRNVTRMQGQKNCSISLLKYCTHTVKPTVYKNVRWAETEAFGGKCEIHLPLLSQNIKWRKHSEKVRYIDDNIKI